MIRMTVPSDPAGTRAGLRLLEKAAVISGLRPALRSRLCVCCAHEWVDCRCRCCGCDNRP